MYGGKEANDEAAMKAASNELAGLVHVFKCAVSAVHLPLAALIDLKGYRLAAFALLPIDKTTIVYGSADGGKNVVNKSVFASNKMKQLASALNLMEHSGNIMHDFFFFFFSYLQKFTARGFAWLPMSKRTEVTTEDCICWISGVCFHLKLQSKEKRIQERSFTAC